MASKQKFTRVVGTKGWKIEIPTPPKRATHARLICFDDTCCDGSPKKIILEIDDFACFRGVVGDFRFLKLDKARKVLEEFDGEWTWNGSQVVGIEKLRA